MAYTLSLSRGIALSTLALLAASPALAEGKKDRAQEAVAAARAKVEIAAKLGAIGEVPRLQAAAAAALRTAEEDLSGDHKVQAIADANRAQQLAEEAIGYTQRNRAAAVNAQVGAAAATTAAAQDAAAEANARAADAERAAAQAQAEAAAARSAPPVVVQQPAPAPAPATTVTTETAIATPTRAAAPRRVVHRVVHHTGHRPAARTSTRVTTTVRTQ